MNPDDANSPTPADAASAPRPALTRDTTFVKPDDPSQYIRTYAKDVAMLTNTPAPKPAAAPADATRKESPTAGIALPDVDESPVNSREPASPKEFKQEVVEVSKADSDGIFANPQAAAATPVSATPLMPQASIGVSPSVMPSGITPAPPAPSPSEDRESILARLRGIAAPPTQPAAPVTTTPTASPIADAYREPVADTAVIAPSIPLRVAAPEFSNAETVPVPPIVPLTSSAPSVPVALQRPTETAGPAPLHTFTTDFADRVDQQRASTFSVLAAQSDSGVRAPAAASVSRGNGRRIWLPLAGGAVIILLGIGIAAGAYSYTHKTPAAPVVHGVPSIITFDESKEVTGAGSALAQNIVAVANGASVAGNIVVTYLSENGIPQEGGAVINALNLGAPDILLRNIDPASTVGVVSNASGQAYPFFAFKVNSYERTFAGMLAWEPSMAADLSTFYPAYSVAIAPAATSIASSSAAAVPAASPFFSDDVVDNQDVRVLRDAQGRSIMLYGYHNKDTLLIARDEAAFTILVNRLDASAQ